MKFQNHMFLKRYKALKEDKKGATAIEVVIGTIIFILLFCFLTDLFMVSYKYYSISQVNNFVARTAGMQGGFKASAPEGYPGAEKAYVNVNQIGKKVAEDFNNAGIEEFDVLVNGYNVTSGSETPDIDYGEPIRIETKVKYKWALVSNFAFNDIEQSVTSKRSTVSWFKYRYDTWNGE